MKVTVDRIDPFTLKVKTASGLDIRLFASEQVPIDRASLAEIDSISELGQTVDALRSVGFFGDFPARVERSILTPDFHKGAGIPVGTVIDARGFVAPKTAGSDIGCGMRLMVTDLTLDDFQRLDRKLDDELRHCFFEGGRDIPMDERGREGILRYGAPALAGAARDSGIWNDVDLDRHDADICRHHRGGCWQTSDVWMFGDYIRGSGGVSHDEAIGSIGGGNHFVEVQVVEETFDGATAYRWGVRRGMIAVMIHTGSVGLGSMVGSHFMDVAKSLYPVDLAKPERGFYVLPTVGPQETRGLAYLSAMGLAANFAVVNRLMLGVMVLRCLSKVTGRKVEGRLVYDAPHNLVWSDGEHRHVHRKGACPAECEMADAAFPDGHPVIIPGSMGDSSYLLKGTGSVASLCSAPHGAGRLAKRGEGRKGKSEELDPIRIVTKIDPAKTRPDIAAELRKTMMEEAPSQYKPVTPVIDTVHGAGIAQRVARMRPLLTIKG